MPLEIKLQCLAESGPGKTRKHIHVSMFREKKGGECFCRVAEAFFFSGLLPGDWKQCFPCGKSGKHEGNMGTANALLFLQGLKGRRLWSELRSKNSGYKNSILHVY